MWSGAFSRYFVRYFILVLIIGGFVSPAAAAESDRDARWTASSSEFKAQLHALAGEALMLEIKPVESHPAATGRVSRLSRAARRDGETRLADSLRDVNALLSMVEIAEHSDRGDRVSQILLLWLESNRITLADDLKNAGGVPKGASIDPATASFLEELKIIWRRMDDAYVTLEKVLA